MADSLKFIVPVRFINDHHDALCTPRNISSVPSTGTDTRRELAQDVRTSEALTRSPRFEIAQHTHAGYTGLSLAVEREWMWRRSYAEGIKCVS